MAKFRFTALDAKGREQKGIIEAPEETSALTLIRERGLFPVEVSLIEEAVRRRAVPAFLKMEIRMPALFSRVSARQLTLLTRQLSTLVGAGLPLLRAINVLIRQERNPRLRSALEQIADAIQSGSTLAEALAQHPRIFSRLYVNMVRAGEVGGVLDQVLDRLAEYLEKSQRIRSKVISAMIYPVVVLVMASGILTFLMVVIIPKFEEIFADLLEGAEMPPLTRFVLNTSKAFASNMAWVVGVVVAVVILMRLLRMTQRGRHMVDMFRLHIPLFGQLARKTAIARFSRTLGTLMSAGVPVLQALNIVRDTAGNEVIARAIGAVHDSVKEGESMAAPMESAAVFPPMVVSMVEVGDETGRLPEMLMKIAERYDEEVDTTVAGLTSIIEPVLIIFMAVVVGTIVIALFLPLISIIGKLSA
ncbi:MAG: type II secretion system F family protein [Verrucomicrobia bacterium]|nr:MAG: type II secretion system F family protein [Verrucomicrobiota bacterium]